MADDERPSGQLASLMVPDSDEDSAISVNDTQLSVISLTESDRDFVVENGRTYHSLSEGKYILPNDEVSSWILCTNSTYGSASKALNQSVLHQEESDRLRMVPSDEFLFPEPELIWWNLLLDMQHHHFFITFGGKIHFAPGADRAHRVLDVGTGTADAHPAAEVIGVDLSPIQPLYVPTNCRFELDDLEKEWTWSQPFDYIFSRMMVGSFANFSHLAEESYHQPTLEAAELID
ncbi:hypothetical protein GX48_04720 [Paracoccidioides brasiliensis]|nr:hypothetical protein GX48_04720 [Paracoccidioides brasiliensis]